LKLKIDENLPAECATLLRNGGFEADTVVDEGFSGADDSAIAARLRAEDRVLVTLDLDFGNIRSYPPAEHSGIIVLRLRKQDKYTVLALMQRLVLALTNRTPAGELWIVEPDRIRFHAKTLSAADSVREVHRSWDRSLVDSQTMNLECDIK